MRLLGGLRFALTFWLLFNVWRTASWPVFVCLLLLAAFTEIAARTFSGIAVTLSVITANIGTLREIMEEHRREVFARTDKLDDDVKAARDETKDDTAKRRPNPGELR